MAEYLANVAKPSHHYLIGYDSSHCHDYLQSPLPIIFANFLYHPVTTMILFVIWIILVRNINPYLVSKLKSSHHPLVTRRLK